MDINDFIGHITVIAFAVGILRYVATFDERLFKRLRKEDESYRLWCKEKGL